MKKILTMLIIFTAIAACNNKSETTTTTTKDSVRSAESPLMDAVSTAGSVGKMMQDSTRRIKDSRHKK